jgi:hypothetical protein
MGNLEVGKLTENDVAEFTRTTVATHPRLDPD